VHNPCRLACRQNLFGQQRSDHPLGGWHGKWQWQMAMNGFQCTPQQDDNSSLLLHHAACQQCSARCTHRCWYPNHFATNCARSCSDGKQMQQHDGNAATDALGVEPTYPLCQHLHCQYMPAWQVTITPPHLEVPGSHVGLHLVAWQMRLMPWDWLLRV
jgi:hypothetical protein